MHSVAKRALLCFVLLGVSSAVPVHRREVPQEHAHQDILDIVDPLLQKNNPAGIKDVVFGLLGDAAAAGGEGSITDPDCLQQAIADQAFTNAKAEGDVAGMTAALIYRALERNTGSVGLASKPCTSIKAVNPQIAAIQQHQDPASSGAAATNKAIVLELAKQIASIGGNPLDALKSGTFAPGKIGDPTAKGNTCDDANDQNGCINTDKLLVPDASDAEISAAVAGVAPAATSSSAAAATSSTTAAAAAAATSSAAAASTDDDSSTDAILGNGLNVKVGNCTNPTVIFAPGIDGRKATEFSFEPENQVDFAHDSALNPDIIYQFMCDTLVNRCGFKETDTEVTGCRAAQKTADGLGRTGKSADSFNSFFGITSDFASLDSGAAAAGGSDGGEAQASTTAAAASPTNVAIASGGSGGSGGSSSTAALAGNGANVKVGTCTNPTVIFAAGLDGRKATEFSFEPENQGEFNHGTALNPDIIFQFMCDTLVNKCGFKQTDAEVTGCRSAQKTADGFGKTGKAADSFNSFFGIKSNFASLDGQLAAGASSAVGSDGGAAQPTKAASTKAASTAAASASAAAATAGSGNGASTASATAAASAAAAAASKASAGVKVGTCGAPTIEFGPGLAGRGANEFAFAAIDSNDFNHGSALNIKAVSDFICNQLVNKCGIKNSDPIFTSCQTASATASTFGKTGAAADSWNGHFGVQTDFASVVVPAADQ